MSQLTLVRHGQANSQARDEISYDRLSPLGHQQATWLGDYFRTSGEGFARVVCGTLTRHVETAQAIGLSPDLIRDARLNEMEYFTLAHLMADQHGIPIPQDREGFVQHLPKLLGHWQNGSLSGAPESFADFEARVHDVMTDLSALSGPSLVVTSGGLIGMAMRLTMGLDLRATAHACLAIQNTSLHRWQKLPTGLALMQFNSTPHLDTIQRRHAQTHL